MEELQPLRGRGDEVEQQSLDASKGIPCRPQRFTWIDIGAIAVVLLASVIAVITVFRKATAMSIGQTNQLVVLGLALSIMNFCTQRELRRLMLLYEVRLGASTLQNFDGILRSDYFAPTMNWPPRLVMWISLLLPLGLAASYKPFSGGATEQSQEAPEMEFGMTAAPGYQLIGNGASLLVNVYLPFWIHPAIGRTYGFNLFIPDNSIAAVLDAARPSYLTQLQSSLEDDQSILITVAVNATVAENINPSKFESKSDQYWKNIKNSYVKEGHTADTTGPKGTHTSIWAGQKTPHGKHNWTVVFLSLWNSTKPLVLDTTQNETFESQAERFVVTRRTCVGTWNITRTNLTLHKVENLQTAGEVRQNQSIIQNNDLAIAPQFLQFLGEYGWDLREGWNQPVPDSSHQVPRFIPNVNTRSALVASMFWARITSLEGPERPSPSEYDLSYSKVSTDIKMIKRAQTSKRSPWLILILVVHPLLTILALLAKLSLFGTPISDDFGVVSLIAGMRDDGITKLYGAALSGKLSKKMRVQFVVEEGKEEHSRSLRLRLDSNDKSDTIDAKKQYG